MKVPEAILVQIIAEASPRMGEAKYVTSRVERLMRAQPSICQYVMSFEKELGVEGVVSVLFFVALAEQAVSVASGRSPARVSYHQLDAAATSVPDLEAMATVEPELASFVASNIDLGPSGTPVARRLLAHAAAALLGQ